MLVDDVAPQVDQVTRDVDFHRTRFVARAAQAGRLRQILEITEPLKQRRDQRADRPGIDAAVRVSADLAVNRARVEARAAADAAQRLAIFLAREDFAAAVVDQDEMEFLGAIALSRDARAAEDVRVDRDRLAGRAAGEKL